MAKKDYTSKPCKKCGSTERYKNGACIPCSRAADRRYKKRNPDKIKQYRIENKDKYREYAQKWRDRNPEKSREASRRWKDKNKDYVRAKYQEWSKANPENVSRRSSERRAREKNSRGSYTDAEFKALCDQYNNRCLRCGKKKKLTADHVVPLSMGGTNYISNIQPLCGSCNSVKGTKIKDYRTKNIFKRWIQRRLL